MFKASIWSAVRPRTRALCVIAASVTIAGATQDGVAQTGGVRGKFDNLAGVAQPQVIQRAMATSQNTSAVSVAFTCSPCTVFARETDRVKFSMQVPARMAAGDNLPMLQLARVVPGKAPQVLGVLNREGAANGMVLYSLSVPFTEQQPGSFLVAVYAQTREATYATTQDARSVVRPVEITVQNRQPSGNSSSGWTGLVAGLINSVINDHGGGQAKNNPDNAGQKTPSSDGANAQQATVRGRGLSFNLPPGFSFHHEIADAGGPLSLRNFESYQGGGVVPPGGAETEVTSVPVRSTTVQSLLRSETGAGSSSSSAIDTAPAQIASYTDAFAPGLSYDSQAAYVAQDGRIYKFFLTYRSGDAGAAAFHQAFSAVLTTTHFTAQ